MLQDLELNVKLRTNQSPFPRSLFEYDRRRLLGTGGFSQVFEAVCRNTGQTVALKLIEKNVIKKQGLRNRVLQEINIQCLLSHPSILKLFTAFEDENYICMVLEYCSEGDLASIVKKGISKKDVKGMMRQIVDGLQYLHLGNIVHRDLKLANILLREDQQIKIADFGLATRITYPGEPHMTMCGTPNYISPEIVSQQVHGLEADLWSLGCVFYTLLVGKPPFETDSPFNTMNRVTSGRYFMPPHLPETAQDLIARLLQKIPDFRITLDEIRNHPFLSESLISSDSGVDTLGSSNPISNKCCSANSKRTISNYSAGYGSFETPKSSKRCRSQDRPLNEERTRIPLYDLNSAYPDTIFYQDHNLQKVESRSYQPPHSLKTGNHLDRGTADFSPGRHYTSTSENYSKRRCEVFCENEILKHKDCDCYKCKRDMEPYSTNSGSPAKVNLARRNFNAQVHARSENVSDSDGADERMKVVPFSTDRLNPTRAELKNVVLSILKNGDVCVERLKLSKGKKLVVEVVRVSGNGLKMQIYYPNKGRGVLLEADPPPLPLSGADATFNCSTLSKENWKKYQKAAQYVDLVKSKTPKLTFYTAKAKCLLMENAPEPDFQVIYYDDTKKITKSRKGVVLTNCGTEFMLTGDSRPNSGVDNDWREHYNYFQECYHRCCFLEAQLTSLSLSVTGGELKVFPAILGKQPACRLDNPIWDSCIESPNIFHSTKYPSGST